MTTKSEPLADKICRELANRIISGKIEAGTKLLQDHIAEEFGASHVPVREAFRRLEQRGLAKSEPRRGVRVSGFTSEDVREVAEMRASLESLALRHAAPHITQAIIDAAEKAILDGDNARDVQSWEEANRRFHRVLLKPCGMPRLLQTIDDLYLTSARFLFAGWRSEWGMPTNREHHAILNAVRNRDIDHAARLLAKHVRYPGHQTKVFI